MDWHLSSFLGQNASTKRLLKIAKNRNINMLLRKIVTKKVRKMAKIGVGQNASTGRGGAPKF